MVTLDKAFSIVEVGESTVIVRIGRSVLPGGIAIFPCEGEYPVYDDLTYDVMNEDTWCDEAYVEAIWKTVENRSVLDIGTGRDANWAIEAVRAGARKVYAVEVLPEWAEAARKAVKEAGLSESITVITGCSTEITLPEKVDVCVSEIIGSIGGSEGAAASIQDARLRFMADSGICIPHRCTTGIAGASLEKHYPDGIALDPEGVDMVGDIFTAVGHPFDLRLSLEGSVADVLVTDIAEVEELRFDAILPTAGEDHVRLNVTHGERLTGLVLWPRLQAMRDGMYVDPLRQETTGWLPVYAPLFPDWTDVRAGDVVDVTFRWKLSDDLRHPDYYISGTVERAGRPDVPFEWNSPHHSSEFRSSDTYRWLFPGS